MVLSSVGTEVMWGVGKRHEYLLHANGYQNQNSLTILVAQTASDLRPKVWLSTKSCRRTPAVRNQFH
jgi:hypothetical protein